MDIAFTIQPEKVDSKAIAAVTAQLRQTKKNNCGKDATDIQGGMNYEYDSTAQPSSNEYQQTVGSYNR